MDTLICTSCMTSGSCLPVTSVKCTVHNELIFCQNKECIHYFLPLNVLSYQNNSTVSYTDDVAENKSKWTVKVYHTPPRQSEIPSKSQVQVTTESAVNSRVPENVARETKNTISEFSSTCIKNKAYPWSTSQPVFRTTYSHYKRSVVRQAKRQADYLRLKLFKENREVKCCKLSANLLSTGQRFV
ncbi:hypothetical protein MN116_004221 [Schistosoma mekongi]|uniref:Uncharacterized protein n=1 Tax=Schistosoma mekongi TaxID=38744 RepID=A0AAE1ZFT5_SCHME|nr:hypothetical protein MN116_004221 [Schistosoma mekongi]